MSDAHQAEGQHQEPDEQDDPETIALARDMGWRPESEWKGPPPKGGFFTATEFVRRGEKVLPIVRAEAKKAKEEAAALRAEIDALKTEHRDTIRRIERMSTAALENQRLQITSQYAQRKEAAVEVGDKDAYRQANKDEREALDAIDERLKENDDGEKKADDKKAELPKEVKTVIDEWLSENSWFSSNKKMNDFANKVHARLLQEKPGLTLRQNLDRVRKETVKEFPEAFDEAEGVEEEEEAPRRRGSPVEGGSRVNGGSGGSKYSKLPPEAKAQCDKFIKEDGLFLEKGESAAKDMAKARERYAEIYLGDVS